MEGLGEYHKRVVLIVRRVGNGTRNAPDNYFLIQIKLAVEVASHSNKTRNCAHQDSSQELVEDEER